MSGNGELQGLSNRERKRIVAKVRREAMVKARGKMPMVKKKRPLPRPTQPAKVLYEMAEQAREGIPPATSSARKMIDEAQEGGDFSKAIKLRDEVKERAGELVRIAKAQEKRERRAQRAK
jgi:hypothetical protein